MKTTIVSINDLRKDNKRFCLSALRATKSCHKCHLYDTCESKIVNEEYDKLKVQKSNVFKNYNNKISQINQLIEKL